MNRLVKGSVAGALGVALLMGSFGTYAVWTDTEVVQGGTITAGTLDIVSVGERAQWFETSTGEDVLLGPGDHIVPGDSIKLRVPLDVTATGNNLRAALDVNLTLGDVVWDIESLNVTKVPSYGGKPFVYEAGKFTVEFGTEELAALNSATELTAEFDFPMEVGDGIDADAPGVDVDRGESIILPDATVTLRQVRD